MCVFGVCVFVKAISLALINVVTFFLNIKWTYME